MIAELEELAREYDRMCQRFRPQTGRYTFLTERRDDGSPHVEFDGDRYHYIATERGLELSRRVTQDRTEILYWLIYDVSFWESVSFEFKNRVEGQDCRRIMFAKWQELMERTDGQMASRLGNDIAGILSENPFIDRPAD